MRRISDIPRVPRPALQRERLERWLHEWELDCAIAKPSGRPPLSVPPAAPGAAAAADGFVVSERLVAEGDVVHRPLAGSGDPEGAQQRVDHAL